MDMASISPDQHTTMANPQGMTMLQNMENYLKILFDHISPGLEPVYMSDSETSRMQHALSTQGAPASELSNQDHLTEWDRTLLVFVFGPAKFQDILRRVNHNNAQMRFQTHQRVGLPLLTSNFGTEPNLEALTGDPNLQAWIVAPKLFSEISASAVRNLGTPHVYCQKYMQAEKNYLHEVFDWMGDVCKKKFIPLTLVKLRTRFHEQSRIGHVLLWPKTNPDGKVIALKCYAEIIKEFLQVYMENHKRRCSGKPSYDIHGDRNTWAVRNFVEILKENTTHTQVIDLWAPIFQMHLGMTWEMLAYPTYGQLLPAPCEFNMTTGYHSNPNHVFPFQPDFQNGNPPAQNQTLSSPPDMFYDTANMGIQSGASHFQPGVGQVQRPDFNYGSRIPRSMGNSIDQSNTASTGFQPQPMDHTQQPSYNPQVFPTPPDQAPQQMAIIPQPGGSPNVADFSQFTPSAGLGSLPESGFSPQVQPPVQNTFNTQLGFDAQGNFVPYGETPYGIGAPQAAAPLPLGMDFQVQDPQSGMDPQSADPQFGMNFQFDVPQVGMDDPFFDPHFGMNLQLDFNPQFEMNAPYIDPSQPGPSPSTLNSIQIEAPPQASPSPQVVEPRQSETAQSKPHSEGLFSLSPC